MKTLTILLILSLALSSCSSVNRKGMQNICEGGECDNYNKEITKNECIEIEESWGSYIECGENNNKKKINNRKTNSALKYAGVGLIYGIPIAVGLYSGFWAGWGVLGLTLLPYIFFFEDTNDKHVIDYAFFVLFYGAFFGGPMVAGLTLGTEAGWIAFGASFGLVALPILTIAGN
jgi:hypothetical protein